jgi:hypothetical protein
MARNRVRKGKKANDIYFTVSSQCSWSSPSCSGLQCILNIICSSYIWRSQHSRIIQSSSSPSYRTFMIYVITTKYHDGTEELFVQRQEVETYLYLPSLANAVGRLPLAMACNVFSTESVLVICRRSQHSRIVQVLYLLTPLPNRLHLYICIAAIEDCIMFMIYVSTKACNS